LKIEWHSTQGIAHTSAIAAVNKPSVTGIENTAPTTYSEYDDDDDDDNVDDVIRSLN